MYYNNYGKKQMEMINNKENMSKIKRKLNLGMINRFYGEYYGISNIMQANEAILEVNKMIASKIRDGFLYSVDSLTFMDIVAYEFLREEIILIPDCDAVLSLCR